MKEQEQSEEAASPGGEQAGFEQNLQKLERIVSKLEEGNLPLDRALELYEEGVEAYRLCHKTLQEAESRVTKLVETMEGELAEEPFEVPEDRQ